MYSLSANKNFIVGGKTFAEQATVTADVLVAAETTVPIAYLGNLTLRTSNIAGNITMTGNFSIGNSTVVDVYWQNANLTWSVQHNCTTGNVTGQVVPISGGGNTTGGANLPIANTTVIVATVQVVDMVFSGTELQSLVAAVDSGPASYFGFYATSTLELGAILQPNSCYDWLFIDNVISNPLAGDSITSVHMSHAGTVSALNQRASALLQE